MRLLEYKSNDNFILHEFIGTKVPVYAILSHTWATGEVTIQEVENGTGKDKAGWKKIVFCAKQADADGLRYLWVDTCCIDKKNAVELQEAINSMFRWYQNAARCYVYMSDVSIGEDDEQDSPPKWEAAFKKSRWFRRGWTLQELIAPSSVEFFDSNGRQIGSKEELTQQIHDVTRIPVTILRGDALTEFDVNERMSWARGRETMRPEDMAYSLLGILGVHMPLIYGEGMPNALNRLQWEIERRPNEQTRGLSRNPILSPHPVGRNYRMVIVMVIHWEGDGLETMVSPHTFLSVRRMGLILRRNDCRSSRLSVSSRSSTIMRCGIFCSVLRLMLKKSLITGPGPMGLISKKRIFKSFITSEIPQR